MSIDRTTRVGPFAACKFTMVDTTEALRQCMTCGTHPNRRDDKFCFKCGGMVGSVNVPMMRPSVRFDEVMVKLEEKLYIAYGDEMLSLMSRRREHYYTPNMRRTVGETYDDESAWTLTATTAIIDEEIKKFIDLYAKEIEVLRQEYGAENVEICWGIIHTVS